MQHDVFLRYCSRDRNVADTLCAILESEGATVWMAPRDVTPGSAWADQVVAAIEGAKIALMIFSGARLSLHVKRELQRAIDNGVSIMVVSTATHPANERLQSLEGPVKWIDMSGPPTDARLREVAAMIVSSLSPSAESSAAPPMDLQALPPETPKFPQPNRIRSRPDHGVRNVAPLKPSVDARPPAWRKAVLNPYAIALAAALLPLPVMTVASLVAAPSAKPLPDEVAKAPALPRAAQAAPEQAIVASLPKNDVAPGILEAPSLTAAEQPTSNEPVISSPALHRPDEGVVKPVASAKRAPTFRECDLAAASADDPDKPEDIAGVATARLISDVAIKACSDAVAAQPGMPRLSYQLGRAFLAAKRYKEAMGAFRAAATGGSGAAENSLGIMYLNGYGIARDDRKAAAFYQKAAEKGVASGMLNLARLYMLGIGVSKDVPRALRYLSSATNAGSASARRELAAYYKGNQPARSPAPTVGSSGKSFASGERRILEEK